MEALRALREGRNTNPAHIPILHIQMHLTHLSLFNEEKSASSE